MPVPSDPTNHVVVEADADAADVSLTFSHNGTNLWGFELLYKDPGDEEDADNWQSWHLGPASDFLVSGTNYEITVGATDEMEWAIRAVGTDGLVSNARGPRKKNNPPKGVWFLPFKNGKLYNGGGNRDDLRVWISADSVSYSRPQEAEVFETPYREEKIINFAKLHLPEGSVSGFIRDKGQYTAWQWRRRLKRLIRRQENYRIALVSKYVKFWSIKFPEGYDYEQMLNPKNVGEVTIPFIVVNLKPNRKKR